MPPVPSCRAYCPYYVSSFYPLEHARMNSQPTIPRIPDAILTARLPVTALRLWLAIRKCQGTNGTSWHAFKHYGEMIGVGAQQVSKNLLILEKAGYLERLEGRHLRCIVPSTEVIQTDNKSELSKQTTELSKQTSEVIQTDNKKLSKQTTPYNPESNPERIQKKNPERARREKEKQEIPYSEIISDLNSQTGKHFRVSSEATRRLIRARWEEGYRLADFEAVHRNQSSRWLGTEQAQYLRPETLYKPSHFESYLNAGTGKNDGHTSRRNGNLRGADYLREKYAGLIERD